MTRSSSALILFSLLLLPGILGSYSGPTVDGDEPLIWSPQGPIQIDSDSELVAMGLPGSGSQVDPYILADLVIDANGTAFGIKLGNLTNVLQIRNCTIVNGLSYGIYMESCENTWIRGCNITGFVYGILSYRCGDIVLQDCFLRNNSFGILDTHCTATNIISCEFFYNTDYELRVISSNDIRIIGNKFESNLSQIIVIGFSTYIDITDNDLDFLDQEGYLIGITNSALVDISNNSLDGGITSIYLLDTIQVDLHNNMINDSKNGVILHQSTLNAWNNTFLRSGFFIYRDVSSYTWLGQSNIDPSNLANNKPIHFLKDQESVDDLSGEVGQIIIHGVENATLSDISSSDVPSGVQIFESNNITLKGVNVYDAYVGITLSHVTNSNLTHCKVESSESGVELYYCDDNEIMDNFLFESNDHRASELVYVFRSDGNHFHRNVFFSNSDSETGYGIFLYFSNDNEIWDNYFFYNNKTGDQYQEMTFQAMDFIGSNSWYSTESIGNYWRDWRTPDNDSNGIVDIPYPIGASGAVMPQDHYPLTTCPVVAPPTNVSVKHYNGRLLLYWVEPFQTNFTWIQGYNVYRGYNESNLTLLASTRADTPYFLDLSTTYGYDYYYQVTAVNQLIESDPSEIIIGNLDGFPPIINITSPLNNSYINIPDIQITWEASDNESGLKMSEIRIVEGPWLDVGSNLTHNFTGLPEGPHTVQVRATDNSSRSSIANVSFYVDLTLPKINITSPAEGDLLTSRMVTVSWEAMDLESGIDRFEVRPDCCNWTDSDWENGHTFFFEDDGIHGVEVAAIDRAGNRIEVGITFTVDSFLPDLTILTPQDGLMSQDGTIKVTWTGGDNGTGLKGYWFRVNDWNWTFMGDKKDRTLWSLYDGVYSIQVKAEDNARNIRIEEVVVTVDGTIPNLRILNPPDGSFISVSPVSVKWNGTDATSGIDRFEIRLGDNQWIDVGLDRSYTIVNLQEGEYRFRVRAFDRAGNSVELLTSFTLDQTRPEMITYSPSGNEVDPEEVISVTFNERMQKQTMQFRVEDVKGSLEWKGDRVVFIPEKNLTYDKLYNITVLGWDLAGNRMDSLIWSFRTTNKGSVQGYVVDKNGDPIQFALIHVEDGNQTRSREDGYFTLDLESGTRIMIVEAEGYRTVKVPIEIEPGEIYTVDSLVMSKDSDKGFLTWSCLLWALLVVISLAVVSGAAMYINSRRRSGDLGEE